MGWDLHFTIEIVSRFKVRRWNLDYQFKHEFHNTASWEGLPHFSFYFLEAYREESKKPIVTILSCHCLSRGCDKQCLKTCITGLIYGRQLKTKCGEDHFNFLIEKFSVSAWSHINRYFVNNDADSAASIIFWLYWHVSHSGPSSCRPRLLQ